MTARQHERVGVQVASQLAIQLAISDQGACEGDTFDVGTKEEGWLDHGGSRVGSEGGVVVEVDCEAGEASSHTY